MLLNYSWLSARVPLLAVVCLVSMPWTIQAENKANADHKAAANPEYGSTAAPPKGPVAAGRSAAAREALRKDLAPMSEASLAELAKGLKQTINLNPESFGALVDKLPALSEDGSQDKALREKLKQTFESQAELLGTSEDLVLLVGAVLADRSEEPVASEQDLLKLLDEKIAELEKAEGDPNGELKKLLEDQLLKTPEDLLAQQPLPDNSKGELPIDPSALGGGGSGSGSGGDPGAGAGSDPGAGSGSGSGAGSGDSGKSPSAERTQPERDNRFSDLARAFENKPEENSPASDKSESSSFELPKRRSALASDEPGVDAQGQGNPDPFMSDESKLPPTPQKLGQLGNKSPLSPLAAGGGAAGGAGGSGLSDSGGFFGGGAGMPLGGMGMGGMGAGGGGGYGAGASGGFPFSSPDFPAPGGVGQKFDYARSNPYGSANSGGVSAAAGQGTDEGFGNAVTPALAAAGISLPGLSLGGAAGAVVSSRPAFTQAIRLILGGMCERGNLRCDRSREPAANTLQERD